MDMIQKTFITIAIFILVGLLGGLGYAMNSKAAPNQIRTPIESGSSTISTDQSQLSKTNTVEVALPKTLRIPKINVTAAIESVGLDKEKKMDVPKEVMNVAWYNLGSKPGKVGNSAVAGHVDTPTGSAAIFYDLKKLQIGDTIEVIDENQKSIKFAVTKIENYKTELFPLDEVFGPTDKKRLNLITCGGTWDKTKKSYSERVVVYSELIE